MFKSLVLLLAACSEYSGNFILNFDVYDSSGVTENIGGIADAAIQTQPEQKSSQWEDASIVTFITDGSATIDANGFGATNVYAYDQDDVQIDLFNDNDGVNSNLAKRAKMKERFSELVITQPLVEYTSAAGNHITRLGTVECDWAFEDRLECTVHVDLAMDAASDQYGSFVDENGYSNAEGDQNARVTNSPGDSQTQRDHENAGTESDTGSSSNQAI